MRNGKRGQKAKVTAVRPSATRKGLYFVDAETAYGPIRLPLQRKPEVGEYIMVREQKNKTRAEIIRWEEVR